MRTIDEVIEFASLDDAPEVLALALQLKEARALRGARLERER